MPLRLLALLAAVLIAAPAGAQDYPSRPLKIVVPAGAGGPNDILARLAGAELSARLGQPVIIENRPGAGTNIGTQAVVNAAPDGYTLLAIAHSSAINASLYSKLPFNFLNDIVPVAGIAQVPNVVEVTASLPVNSLAELIAYAKANPGKLNFCSTGSGTSAHLAGELFKSMTGTDIVHVPYRGSAPALTDLISGQVQLMFNSIPASIPHIRAGRLRALAVTSPTRSDALPDVPPVADTVPGYDIVGWFGLGVPKDTPPAVVMRLNRELNASLAEPRMKARLAELSASPHVISPEAYRKFIAEETEKWAKVVKASGATVD